MLPNQLDRILINEWVCLELQMYLGWRSAAHKHERTDLGYTAWVFKLMPRFGNLSATGLGLCYKCISRKHSYRKPE